MHATIEKSPFAEPVRKALLDLFQTAAYVTSKADAGTARTPAHEELAPRWARQRLLDETVAAIAAGRDEEAIANLPRLSSRPSVLVGLLGRMMQSGRPALTACAVETIGADPNVPDHRGHPPLYSVANECSADAGAAIVRALVAAGARVNHASGVTGATALHMAARRGHVKSPARCLISAPP